MYHTSLALYRVVRVNVPCFTCIIQGGSGECTMLQENLSWLKLHRDNQKYFYPNLKRQGYNSNISFTEYDIYTFGDFQIHVKGGVIYSFYNVTTCS
jgi:hypothetical protein